MEFLIIQCKLKTEFQFLIQFTYFFSVFQTGTCALFFAAQGGFLDIVKLLIDHGVPVDIPSYVSSHKSKITVFVFKHLDTFNQGSRHWKLPISPVIFGRIYGTC